MSRIGKVPVPLFDGIKTVFKDDILTVNGPNGALSQKIDGDITLEISDKEIVVKRRDDSRRARSMHGLMRTLINNMVTGVKDGFTRKLDIVGVGYRADVQGNVLNLNLGFSHPIKYNLPQGIKAQVEKQTSIILQGADKQLLGQVAAEIRAFRKPEPYKGKGIIYAGEHIRRKAGKAVAK